MNIKINSTEASKRPECQNAFPEMHVFPVSLDFPKDSDTSKNITVGEINRLTELVSEKISSNVDVLVNNHVIIC